MHVVCAALVLRIVLFHLLFQGIFQVTLGLGLLLLLDLSSGFLLVGVRVQAWQLSWVCIIQPLHALSIFSPKDLLPAFQEGVPQLANGQW